MLKKILSHADLEVDGRFPIRMIAVAVKPRVFYAVGEVALACYQYHGKDGRNGYRLEWNTGHQGATFRKLETLIMVELKLGDLEFYQILL